MSLGRFFSGYDHQILWNRINWASLISHTFGILLLLALKNKTTVGTRQKIRSAPNGFFGEI